MKIYRVCLRTQGQTEGFRLSALLGEATDPAAAAATEGTAGSSYTPHTHIRKLGASIYFVALKHRH